MVMSNIGWAYMLGTFSIATILALIGSREPGDPT